MSAAVVDPYTTGKVLKPPYALHRTRTSIRSICTLAYIICVILYIVDGSQCSTEINSFNDDEDGFESIDDSVCWTDPFDGDIRPMLSAIIAIVWNAAEFITLCVNKRGIHPGANLGMDIVLWLNSMLEAIFSFIALSEFEVAPPVYTSATSFLMLASILQFVLFILDTIAVHKWRRTRYGYPVYPSHAPYAPQQPLVGGAGMALNANQPYLLPPAQPGFVYVQVPAAQQQQQHLQQAFQQPLQQQYSGGVGSFEARASTVSAAPGDYVHVPEASSDQPVRSVGGHSHVGVSPVSEPVVPHPGTA